MFREYLYCGRIIHYELVEDAYEAQCRMFRPTRDIVGSGAAGGIQAWWRTLLPVSIPLCQVQEYTEVPEQYDLTLAAVVLRRAMRRSHRARAVREKPGIALRSTFYSNVSMISRAEQD